MRILVTGWRRGIGKAIAHLLEKERHEVVRFEGDVSVPKYWEGPWNVDGLVNCAGVPSEAPVLDEDLSNFYHVLGVNLIGPWLGMRAVIGEWKAAGRGGSIVNIGSIYADDTLRGNAVAYMTSKAGLAALTRSAARRYGRKNIRVNEVRPGFTDTRLTEAYWKDGEYHDFVEDGVAMPGLVDPSEVAHAVLFLLGSQATSITGACLNVDRGWAA